MSRSALTLALALAIAAPALAQDPPALTIYHSSDSRLFNAEGGTVDSGHAVIHEQRKLHLDAGTHDQVIGNLPDYLDPEAISLGFTRSDVRLVSQRLLLSQGHNGTLTGHIGKQVTVYGDNGQSLVQGTLVSVGRNGSLVIGGDVFGPTVVRDYAAVKLTGGEVGGGARLQVRIDSHGSHDTVATLDYPTAGLGWRAAYTGTLESGHSCRLHFRADASIANRSGRDWKNATIKLVAGQPAFAKQGGGIRPMMMERAAAAPPTQSSLGDYRSFKLDGQVNLPDHSVTLTPLYDPRSVDCERSYVYEQGRAWQPPQPNIVRGNDADGERPVISELEFHAFDTLPAGIMRVLERDDDGHAELLGSGKIPDTPRDSAVSLVLGQAFDLRGSRQRTAFKLDKAAGQLDEAFTVTLTNAGAGKRIVTVREHPNRWSQWTLTSSSIQPSRQTPDTLEFQVPVPAHGKATLDYAVHYSWTPQAH
jgi:hypothetical protein